MKDQEIDWTAVATRLLDEGLIPLSEAAKLLPPARRRDGGLRHCSGAALVRLIRAGKLEGCRALGKGWCTSRAAIARFLAWRSSKASNRPKTPVPTIDDGAADRRRRGEAAQKRFEAMCRG